MANTRKKLDTTGAEIGTAEPISSVDEVPEKHYAIPERKPSIWNEIELSDINTYVMNIPTGVMIHTESSNGVSTCFVPNTRYDNGFKRTT